MADIHIRPALIIAAGAIFPPVCVALVALRFYARRTQQAKFGFDDWLTLPGLLSVVGSCIAVIIGTANHATGYRTPPIPKGKTLLTTSSHEQSMTRSIFWSIEVMQILGLTCIKMSFIFFYRRIFLQGSGRPFIIATNTLLALIAAWGLSYFFSLIFICHLHTDAFWTTLAQQKKYCLDTLMWHNSYGISDVILDIFVILLPVPQVLGLQMSGSRKLAVLGVFSMGAFSIFASIMRMVTYLQSTKIEFKPGTDTDILISDVIYWAVLESNIALISCCLPTVYSFSHHKLSGSMSKRYYASDYLSRSKLRRSVIRKQGYREDDYTDMSDTVELTNVVVPKDQTAHSSARAGGDPAAFGTDDDQDIRVTTTFETIEERNGRFARMT